MSVIFVPNSIVVIFLFACPSGGNRWLMDPYPPRLAKPPYVQCVWSRSWSGSSIDRRRNRGGRHDQAAGGARPPADLRSEQRQGGGAPRPDLGERHRRAGGPISL